ncbi:hypothetical protein OE766_28920 [Pararhizobium sp. YC-54]|uniref:hypothetical protein n=1 Tax=Pararhizobium sp. YC-54 TaxID=2986920 RepID=UPI0021F78EB4|nr:hypothetical protein [Pararhizobium sp. YC-54]MCW0002222.1 hypothetical protein [Pararhizobium sp. YC-54]
MITRSEIFREFAVFLQSDPGFSFEEGEEQLRTAGRQMTKHNRREMIRLLKEFETGKSSYRDIQSFWNGARFFIVGEDAVRSFLYRARLVLEQSFSLPDVEDLKAGAPSKRRETPTQLSRSEIRTLQRLGDLVRDIDHLDPHFKADRKKLLLARLTAEDKVGVMELVAAVARGDVTEYLLQAEWHKTAAADLAYMRGNVASSIYSTAQLIDDNS